ncbi:hypothetical protein [Microbacterium sp. NPDC056234]|uniref:hypothetical protein n=1 Tax=Microbacterium sp. NPDC056234 TaxID=3345757 RepID=UPI0035DB4E6A
MTTTDAGTPVAPSGYAARDWIEDPDSPFYVTPELRTHYAAAAASGVGDVDYYTRHPVRRMTKVDGKRTDEGTVQADAPLPYEIWAHEVRSQDAQRRYAEASRPPTPKLVCPACGTAGGTVWLKRAKLRYDISIPVCSDQCAAVLSHAYWAALPTVDGGQTRAERAAQYVSQLVAAERSD